MIETPYRPWMHSLLDRMKELYGKVDAKTIAEALPDGGFFKIKGGVATADDLPVTGNTVGDIFIVSADGSERIWVTSEDHPDGYWEQLGSESESVTPASIIAATGQMTDAQKAWTRSNLGAGTVNPPDVVDMISTTPEIEPEDNAIYQCGTLTSLTISNPPATGKYSIIFYSGTIATTTVGIENFVAEANKRYKITVEDNYATYDSWPYTPT